MKNISYSKISGIYFSPAHKILLVLLYMHIYVIKIVPVTWIKSSRMNGLFVSVVCVLLSLACSQGNYLMIEKCLKWFFLNIKIIEEVKKLLSNTSSENCTFNVCFETEKWLISQQLLFSPQMVKRND